MVRGVNGATPLAFPSNDRPEPIDVIEVPADEETCTRPPLERVRTALSSLGPGQMLEIRTHVREHTFTAMAWARRMGLEIVSAEEQGREAKLVIRRPLSTDTR